MEYRKLIPGEPFRGGDECLSPLSNKWEMVPAGTYGIVPNSNIAPWRRPIPLATFSIKDRQRYIFLEPGDIIEPGDEYNPIDDVWRAAYDPDSPSDNVVRDGQVLHRRPVKD